jgi:uncharacterized protein involved in outer membrane biogenesis
MWTILKDHEGNHCAAFSLLSDTSQIPLVVVVNLKITLPPLTADHGTVQSQQQARTNRLQKPYHRITENRIH